MDPNSKEKILERLTRAQTAAIVISNPSGFDGLAAGLALYLSLTKLGKSVSIYAKEPTVSDATKLYGVDKIGKSQTGRNLVINVENAVNTVDKVTYFLDGDKLRIVIHPLPGSSGVSTNEISFEQAPSNSDLIFVIGFRMLEELKKEIIHEQIISSEAWTISITKEEMGQKFAHSSVSNPQATSLSELTASLLRDLALPLDEDISYNLYAGIAESTNKFEAARAMPATFELASWLLKFGAGKASFAKESISIPRAAEATSPASITTNFNSFGQVDEVPTGQVEIEKTQKDWLKPPKIYKGSESFDTKN